MTTPWNPSDTLTVGGETPTSAFPLKTRANLQESLMTMDEDEVLAEMLTSKDPAYAALGRLTATGMEQGINRWFMTELIERRGNPTDLMMAYWAWAVTNFAATYGVLLKTPDGAEPTTEVVLDIIKQSLPNLLREIKAVDWAKVNAAHKKDQPHA